MTPARAEQSGRRAGRAWAAVVPCATLILTAPAAHAAPSDAAALRRACATGALTAYACAQRGVGAAPAATTPPPVAAPRAPPTPVPTPSGAAPVATAPVVAPVVAPPPRGRRARSRAEAGPAVRPFQDTKKRYDLEIPEGWDLKMQGGFAALSHGDAWIQLRTAAAASPQTAAAAGVDLLRGQYTAFQTTADGAATVGGRIGRRMVLSAQSKAGRPSAIVVLAAPMSAGDNLVVIGGGDPGEAAAIDAGVSSIARTLHFR